DLNGLHFLLIESCTGAFVAFETEFYVLSRERVAVVESDSLTEPELIRQAVGALAPGLGQTGCLRIPGHRFDQGIVQGIEKQKRRDNPRRFSRVKVGGSDGEVQRPGHVSLRLGGDGAKVSAADEQQRQTEAA